MADDLLWVHVCPADYLCFSVHINTTCTAFSQDLRLDHVTRDALAARNNKDAQELVEEQGNLGANLGADQLTLKAGVDDFEKKIPASARRKKKIACSTNVMKKISRPPDCWKKNS